MSETAYQFDYDALAAYAAAQPKTIQPDRTAHVDQFFRDKLAGALPGYEPRDEQIRMARTIATALADKRHFIGEAGTGTGKSLAYLMPTIHHVQSAHCRAIVSTGTIALQEQLVQKDLPFLAQMFSGLRYALAKGKSNYVCPLRLKEACKLDLEAPLFTLVDWARETTTGDRADFPGDPGPDWSKINVDDSCPGISKCPVSSSCFYARARAAWESADIVVTNHTLLAIHLALQEQTDGYATILPEAKVIVLDEAHHLEDEARRAFSIQISSLRFPLLLSQAVKLATIPADDVAKAREMNNRLFTAMRKLAGSEQSRTLTSIPMDVFMEADDMAVAITTIKRALKSIANERADALAERFDALRQELISVVKPNESSDVTWVEVNRYRESERVTIHQTPIEVGGLLRSALWDAFDSVIATSATLTAGGRFNYFRQQVGCPSDALELVVGSPFDYREQGLLYVPRPGTIPEPKDNPLYYSQIAPLVQEILEKTDGRAFVLFTSYRGMNEVYDLLLPRLRWQVLRQGDAPKAELLRQFKAEHSVLFATASFWEGVDVPGEALSAVILTALPFAVPDDPVTKARADATRARGGSDFGELMLPEMILRLKQGVGRLIRTRSDRGIVAILDTRVRTKRYGFTVLDSLPRFRRIEVLENVDAFLNGGGLR